MGKREFVGHPGFFLLSPLLLLAAAGAGAQAPRDEAWQLLRRGAKEKSTEARAAAVGVLGLLPGNARAAAMAEKALSDVKPTVRAAAKAGWCAQRRSKPSPCAAILRSCRPSPSS